LPKRLRLFFLHDRRLLGALSRCAWRTVRDLYRAGLRDRRAVPGMVVSIQTYGDQAANWQPHLHALVTAGVVDGAGAFTPLPLPPAAVAEELFRRRVIAMLRQRGRLEEEVAAGLLAWRDSGFSVHSAIRVAPIGPGRPTAAATSTRPPARTLSRSTRWRCWRGSASTSRRPGSISHGRMAPTPTGHATRGRGAAPGLLWPRPTARRSL
jgi:hypothetical protein